jgi:hypothetical protein
MSARRPATAAASWTLWLRQQVEKYGLIWIEQHSKTFVPKAEPAVTEIDFS